MSVQDLREALAKMAAGELEVNTEEPQEKGVNNVYPNPEGREDGLNAHWGDKPAPHMTFGTAVTEAAHETRDGMLKRLFDAPYQGAQADRDLITGMFNAETVRDAVPPHSVLLRKTASAGVDESLTEQVLRVAGRR